MAVIIGKKAAGFMCRQNYMVHMVMPMSLVIPVFTNTLKAKNFRRINFGQNVFGQKTFGRFSRHFGRFLTIADAQYFRQ